MASLQKTATRDLSTAIAGVIWNSIKEADYKRQLEKSKASEEVKQAAVKLKKEDSDSVPVQDKDLRETVVKIFGPLEGKLLQTEGKVENLSAKITTVAGGIADTQKLIVNQNQILEDKFDQILNIVGNKSAIERRKEAESKFEQLELALEKGVDLSGTFGAEKTATAGYGVLGKLLSGLLGNRFTAQIVAQIGKAIIPKGLRVRSKIFGKSLIPSSIKRFAKNLRKPGASIAKRVLQPFAFHSVKQTGRILSRGAADLFDSVLGRRLWRWGFTEIFLGHKSAQEIAKEIVKIRLAKQGGKKVAKKWSKTAAKVGVKSGAKATARKTTPKVLKKTLKEGAFMRAMSSPRVQAELAKLVTEKEAKKLGIKLAASGAKSSFPFIGTGYALVEGLARLAMGDPVGMALSFGSGIPAAGWGFAILDILRDIDRKAYSRHIQPTILKFGVPSDANIAAFFQEALGIGPDEYEMGNVNIKEPLGIGSDISSISQILGVTKAFGDATGFGREASAAISDAGLSSYPIPRANYPFDVGQFRGTKSIQEGKKTQREEELRMREKTHKEKIDELEKLRKDKKEEENTTNFVGADHSREGYENQKWDFWDWMPDDWFNKKGEGGIGGDDNVQARTPIMGGDGATIQFWGQQGRDLSGEPGVDFSYKDYKSNYNLFPGYVLETGLLYGDRYGNVVVVRSVDPSNGLEFDSLYSHFPDGGIAVKPGQVVSAGEYLGKVGFVSVDVPGVPQMQPNNAGNMSGWHTSVDFFEPGSAARYRNLSAIQSLVTGANGQSPVGLLEKLKPPVKNEEQSSLNNIEANSKLGSAMTGLVENGSMDRKLTQKKIASRLPIVIVNNQVIRSNSNPIVMNKSNNVDGDFFEAYNLAKYSV